MCAIPLCVHAYSAPSRGFPGGKLSFANCSRKTHVLDILCQNVHMLFLYLYIYSKPLPVKFKILDEFKPSINEVSVQKITNHCHEKNENKAVLTIYERPQVFRRIFTVFITIKVKHLGGKIQIRELKNFPDLVYEYLEYYFSCAII